MENSPRSERRTLLPSRISSCRWSSASISTPWIVPRE
ncbi:Uncharacterised protein [Segatella copri]|nr:Uncharacterised protein [Segatella copri]